MVEDERKRAKDGLLAFFKAFGVIDTKVIDTAIDTMLGAQPAMDSVTMTMKDNNPKSCHAACVLKYAYTHSAD